MKQRISVNEAALLAAVVVHFVVCVVHGIAHTRAHVELSPPAMTFVLVVILAGPIVGIVAQRIGLGRAGATIVAATMAGALVFGLVNHFVIAGADHVAHVAGAWRRLFAVTAALLVVSEALGAVVAVRCLTARPSSGRTGRPEAGTVARRGGAR